MEECLWQEPVACGRLLVVTQTTTNTTTNMMVMAHLTDQAHRQSDITTRHTHQELTFRRIPVVMKHPVVVTHPIVMTHPYSMTHGA
jgi:hypothetical protein